MRIVLHFLTALGTSLLFNHYLLSVFNTGPHIHEFKVAASSPRFRSGPRSQRFQIQAKDRHEHDPGDTPDGERDSSVVRAPDS